MKLLRTFSLNLSGTDVQIEAMISFTSYIITNVLTADGWPVNDFSADDMEVFEAHVESRINATTLQALDLDTYATASFTIHDLDGVILAIEHESGHVVERNTPTWTEAAEAWHLDRQYAEALESDAPHAAAAAGFLRPVPVPQNSGIGYRRAA